MLLDSLKGYECRYATESDAEEIYTLLEPLVCDETQHKDIYEMTKRKLSKYIRYAIKTEQCVIVVNADNEITSAYAGDGDAIAHFGTKGTDVISTTLLMHNVLNRIHNGFKETQFVVNNEKQRKAWTVKTLGEDAVSINELGIGFIKVIAKENIEKLYNAIKGNS